MLSTHHVASNYDVSTMWKRVGLVIEKLMVMVLALISSLVIGLPESPDDWRPTRGEQEQVTDTLPPPPQLSIRQQVNAIHYQFMNPDPAKEAWYLITAENGWSADKQNAWWPFSRDVLLGESGFCPNRLRGDIMPFPNSGCIQTKQGQYEDAGFAQLISVHYGPGMWLCEEYSICSKWTIISEPWISMSVFIWLLDREGSQPWCFADWARAYHRCDLAPDR